MEALTRFFGALVSGGLFPVFLIAAAGYLLGSVELGGVRLGTSAVFLTALLFGHFALSQGAPLQRAGLIPADTAALEHTFRLVQNLGLLLFVTAVGLIAGPGFFRDFRRNVGSYVLLAVVIIGLGAGLCALLVAAGRVDAALAAGLLSGALTTTPGYAAAQDAVAHSDALMREVSVGYAVAYPFGVIGVVLFVQIVPRLLRSDMAAERAAISGGQPRQSTDARPARRADAAGMFAFTLAVALGVLLGRLSFPLPGGARFSLGNTGGALLAGLLFGHFGRLGRMDLSVSTEVLETLREAGLMLFLIGAGVPGGAGFLPVLQSHGAVLFLYGALLTAAPMICGYFFAARVLKMRLLNSLGAITGGMTSTPALGTLIRVAGTGDVAAAYAAVYPAALVLVVLASQLIVSLS